MQKPIIWKIFNFYALFVKLWILKQLLKLYFCGVFSSLGVCWNHPVKILVALIKIDEWIPRFDELLCHLLDLLHSCLRDFSLFFTRKVHAFESFFDQVIENVSWSPITMSWHLVDDMVFWNFISPRAKVLWKDIWANQFFHFYQLFLWSKLSQD